MKPVAWRLAVTAVLFLGWVGYLAYLALFTRNLSPGLTPLPRPS